MDDCGTIQGELLLEDLKEGEEVIEPLAERILGRFAQDAVMNPVDATVFAESNGLLDVAVVDKIEKSNVFQVKVRSVLTCVKRLMAFV